MKKVMTSVGLVAACAACCAIPFAVPAIAAVLASAGLGLSFGWDTALCALILLMSGTLLWRWQSRARKAAAAAANASSGCGCNDPVAPKP
jgi:hypothetical protein